MKKSYLIESERLAFLLSLISDRSMSLSEIHRALLEKGFDIPYGELRSILSAFSFLGLIERRKTRKKSYNYQILKPEKT
jgi:DNA-binding PadR family transcriptional regulator